ncbi:hypothetical protein LSH36_401g01013 [Paralvinella palmiformis]|uniref:Uncharacterized protein n=1 Tax=Paralvinella palmiformis TaxID=53620 RepID=A0AAD9JD64_9ANNE|nr:hypothetical protein LSH36_401g01013 [Paralvinella palmiformis]
MVRHSEWSIMNFVAKRYQSGRGDGVGFGDGKPSSGSKDKMTTNHVESSFPDGQSESAKSNDRDPPDKVAEWLEKALECFDKHQLNEAEVLLQRILCSLEGRTFQGREKMFVDALSSLAELYFKRSRTCHRDEMAWHKVMLQSAALQNELVRYCHELEDRREDADDPEILEWNWVEESVKKAEQLMTVIRAISATTEKRTNKRKVFHKSSCQQTNTIESDSVKSPVSSASGEGLGSGQDIREVEVKKVDCDRVQRTIMKLVRQISSDIRQRFVRRKLPEDVFRRTVSSEMIAKCSPMPETKDVLALFENAIIQYNYGMSSEEFRETNVESCELDSDEQGNETVTTDTQSDDQSPANLPYLPTLCRDEVIADADMALEDESYKFPGVLTVWRAYGKCHGPRGRRCLPPFRPYLLQGFEELSPLTESALMSSDQYVPQQDTPSTTSGEASRQQTASSGDMERQTYVTKDKVQHALAMTLAECARVLQKDPHGLNQACELYKYALGILRIGDPEMKGRQELIAHIFKNVGIIRCTQGDITIGSQLMHESMELFSTDDNVDNVNIAEVWYLLGDAFMQQQWKEDTIFEHVMKLVRDELDSEIDQKKISDDVSVDSESSEGGASYCVCAQEALGCYKSALAILGHMRRRKEIHTSLYVDVLTKLGDCSIIVGEYERAVLCYEEALYLCQNTLGSVSLPNSAHILSMLGTTNFLLGTYSKAATMFETANILQQHLYGLEDNFEMAFTLSMLGNTYYVMHHFHKCISWCIKAFELYVNIYKQEIIFVDSLHRWFIIQTLYCLGYAYSTLNFHDKALHNLDLAKNLIEKAEDGDVDVQQHVNVLKVMADVYANLDENEMALEYYQKALDQSLLVGDERSTITLQNQLLNRMAGIHVNTKQYTTAAEYLEQALDCQRNVENSIKGDLIGIMYQLGITYTLSGDIDRALECFNDFCEAFHEEHASPGPELAKALSNLGTLYHLKGCMQDDNEDMMEYLESAEQYYKRALAVDNQSPVCVYYANFLHQQEQYADAVNVMLRYVFLCTLPDNFKLQYNGPEQAVLPEHLLNDLNDTDEVILDPRVFAKFLGILCLKQLSLYEDAQDCLETMVTIVYKSEVSLNHTMLGYALIELGFYVEAAQSFDVASTLEHDSDLSTTNLWICLCLWAYSILYKGCYNVWESVTEAYIDLVRPAPTPIQSGVADAYFQFEDRTLRDSGYYDHTEELAPERFYSGIAENVDVGYTSTSHDIIVETNSSDAMINEDVFTEEVYEEWHTEEVEETPPHILEAILKSQMQAAENTANNNDEVHESSSSVHFMAPVAIEDAQTEEWITEEEVTLETPAAIIAALAGKLTNIDMTQQSSGYTTLLQDSREELVHKSASFRVAERTDVNWLSRQRTVTPPNTIEGLNRNYEHSTDYGGTTDSSRVNRFTFTSQPDTNGNGTMPSTIISSSVTQSRQPLSNTWMSHSDGLNGNNAEKSTSFAEFNANAFADDQQEEVWEVIEETVETPPAILAVMLANQNKQHA